MKEKRFLRELMDERDIRYQQRFEAQSSAINAALLAAEKAVTKAEIATEKRFEGVNEFRGALQDAAKNQITRVEVEAWREQSRDAQATLAARIQLIEGRSQGMSSGWGYLAGFIGVAVGIITVVFMIVRSSS